MVIASRDSATARTVGRVTFARLKLLAPTTAVTEVSVLRACVTAEVDTLVRHVSGRSAPACAQVMELV